VAITRFFVAAGEGYYNDTIVHRADDNENLTMFGSPTSNDEGGWTRFARDETGAPITRMSLTLANHGQDTVDGRLTLHWRAKPGLGRRETVIGRAHARPAEAIDALQLGMRVEGIAAGGEGRLAPAGPGDPCNPRRTW
jgi:cyclophilin family peptidyl-prolyl cis-trans isomerase